MKIKQIVFVLLTVAFVILPVYQQACTEGLADGNATVDGRPLHWKVRMWFGTNRLQFWDNDKDSNGIPETDNDGDGTPDLYPHLGIRSNTNEHPNYENTMMGLNSEGFSIGITVVAPVCTGNTDPLMTHSLGNFTKTSEFNTYLSTFPGNYDAEEKTFRLGNTYGVADRYGKCSEFEYERYAEKTGYYREYKTSNPYRSSVLIGSRKYNLKNIVVRTNHFHHPKKKGQQTNLLKASSYANRYSAAVKNMAKLKAKKKLSVMSLLQGITIQKAENLFITLRRNPVSTPGSNCSTMLIHGVKNGEDPRLSTFWAIMGHSDYSIALPVWVLGVQHDKNKKPPYNLETSIDDDNFASYADFFNDKFYNSYQKIQAFTFPFEKKIVETTNELIMPEWRNRNWKSKAEVAKIGKEMNRYQNQNSKDAFSLMKYLYKNENNISACKQPIDFTIKTNSILGKTASFEISPQKTQAKSTLWNYGDNTTGKTASHTYKKAGKYLVSCTKTDNQGVSKTDWIFVRVK